MANFLAELDLRMMVCKMVNDTKMIIGMEKMKVMKYLEVHTTTLALLWVLHCSFAFCNTKYAFGT